MIADQAGLIAGPLAGAGPAQVSFAALDELMASAEIFIRQFYAENQAGSPDTRLAEVRFGIETAGTYWHTAAELEFGARLAWRSSARCIGRLYWNSLRVRDRREVSGAADVTAESFEHLREATNGGRIRPVITVFRAGTTGSGGRGTTGTWATGH